MSFTVSPISSSYNLDLLLQCQLVIVLPRPTSLFSLFLNYFFLSDPDFYKEGLWAEAAFLCVKEHVQLSQYSCRAWAESISE